MLFFLLFVCLVAHLAVDLALQNLARHLLGDRVLVFSLASDDAILVVIAFVDLSGVEAVNAEVVVRKQLALSILLIPRNLEHLLKATYSLVVVLSDAVAVAQLVVYMHLVSQLKQVVTDVLEIFEHSAGFIHVTEGKRNISMGLLGEVKHLEFLVVITQLLHNVLLKHICDFSQKLVNEAALDIPYVCCLNHVRLVDARHVQYLGIDDLADILKASHKHLVKDHYLDVFLRFVNDRD